MYFGFFYGRHAGPQTIARKCEDLGFDALYVEIIRSFPEPWGGLVGSGETAGSSRLEKDNQYPEFYSHMPDPFLLLMAAACATSRLKLGTGVTLISEREPITMAKAVATLDHYSRGRFIFGVGTGSLPEEAEAFGTPFKKRGPSHANGFVR